MSRTRAHLDWQSLYVQGEVEARPSVHDEHALTRTIRASETRDRRADLRAAINTTRQGLEYIVNNYPRAVPGADYRDKLRTVKVAARNLADLDAQLGK